MMQAVQIYIYIIIIIYIIIYIYTITLKISFQESNIASVASVTGVAKGSSNTTTYMLI